MHKRLLSVCCSMVLLFFILPVSVFGSELGFDIDYDFGCHYYVYGDDDVIPVPMAAVSKTSWYGLTVTFDPTGTIRRGQTDHTRYSINSSSFSYYYAHPVNAGGNSGLIGIGGANNYPAGAIVTITYAGLNSYYSASQPTSNSPNNWASSAYGMSTYNSSAPLYVVFDDTGNILGSVSTSSATISVVTKNQCRIIAIGAVYPDGSYGAVTLTSLDITVGASVYSTLGTMNSTLSTVSSTLSTISSRILTISNSVGSNLGTTVTTISNTLASYGTYLSNLPDMRSFLATINSGAATLVTLLTPLPDSLEDILSALQNISGGIISTPSQDQEAQDAVDRMDDITDEIDSMTDEIEQGTNRPPVSDILPSVNEDILNPTDQSASFAVSTVGSVLEVSFVQTLLIFVVSLCFIRYVIFGRSG